ncbi:MAG: hypothetical protein KDA37_05625, partial [Planctomycetales bacterium]|nr:hypothetical protein [Planctomycetales bacterium]
MKAFLLKQTLATIAVVALLAPAAEAQQTLTWVGTFSGGDGITYQSPINWDFFTAPPYAANSDLVKIGADPGVEIPLAQTAQVSSDLSSTPSPRLVLGEGTGYSGTLNITSSGSLVITNGILAGPANLNVGLEGGTGTLNVMSGSLAVGEQLSSPTNANSASSINLSGSATVTAGSAFLDRNLVISGNSVNFSVTGDAILGGGGV